MCSWQEVQAVGPLLSGGTAFDHTHAHVNWNLGGNFPGSLVQQSFFPSSSCVNFHLNLENEVKNQLGTA